MSIIIDNYSVVNDDVKDIWILCKNEDVKSTVERIDSQYDDAETARVKKVREFLESGYVNGGGEELEITGAIWEKEVSFDASVAVDILIDEFEHWFDEGEFDELLKGQKCMYEVLLDKVVEITKQMAIDELESMLRRAKMIDVKTFRWS